MSYCTLDENISPGTCPRCEVELACLREVVRAARRTARVTVYDHEKHALREALAKLDAVSEKEGTADE